MDEATGVLVGMASGRMEVKVKVKQTETVPGPKVIKCCTIRADLCISAHDTMYVYT